MVETEVRKSKKENHTGMIKGRKGSNSQTCEEEGKVNERRGEERRGKKEEGKGRKQIRIQEQTQVRTSLMLLSFQVGHQ